jgi:plasmid stability protein
METLTVRNLDPEVKRGIKKLGIAHGRSMEAEARAILAEAARRAEYPATDSGGIGSSIRERFAALGGIELDILPRDEHPRAVDLNA